MRSQSLEEKKWIRDVVSRDGTGIIPSSSAQNPLLTNARKRPFSPRHLLQIRGGGKTRNLDGIPPHWLTFRRPVEFLLD